MKTRLSDSPFGIVVDVDGSPASSAAVRWAAQDAAMRAVPLRLVHIVSSAGPGAAALADTGDHPSHRRRGAQPDQLIEEARQVAFEAAPTPPPKTYDKVLHGPTIPLLVELSKKAVLLVVGYQRTGMQPHALMSSVGYHAIRHAHCPVSVIGDENVLEPTSPEGPIVVGVDGSPMSELAIEIAFDEAARRGVALTALHAHSHQDRLDARQPRSPRQPDGRASVEVRTEAVLADHLSGWRERYPDVVVRKVVRNGRPAYWLVKEAETAQLVVVGSRGRGPATDELLGSVSYAVINSARTPVIVARMAA